ncbi:conserved hypothetical protein [Candidatus Brocadia pituitae]|nr:conserved hypothetical protein [Candidatus Brocadia pituitae]
MVQNDFYRKHTWSVGCKQKLFGIIFLAIGLLILISNEFAYSRNSDVFNIRKGVVISTDNIPPVVNDDKGIASKDTSVDIDLIVNDTDPDGMINPDTVTIIRRPANGFVELKGDGIVTYRPQDGFVGEDSFAYTINDNEGAESNEGVVRVKVVSGTHIFTAYNDLSWSAGQINGRITLYTTGQKGLMKDYFTGVNTPVALTITGGNIDDVNIPLQGGNAATDTDAYMVFHGIVDSVGLISYSKTNLTFAFTGLNPKLNYEFVLFGNRNDSSYTDRTTATTIANIESFTNASTPGTDFSGATDPAVAIMNGDNTVNGYVARFTDIKPGINGDMLITVSSPTGQFYANALMLQAIRESADNIPPVVNDDEGITCMNTSVDIDLIVNDTDPDGMINPDTVTIIRKPANGFVELKGDGIVTYQPQDGFVGEDSFAYTIKDNEGGVSNEAMVIIKVDSCLKVQITEGDEWLCFKGEHTPPQEWKDSGFNDSNWQSWPSGFGYGDLRNNNTIFDDMQGNYSTVYVRKGFNVIDPSNVTSMKLAIDCDGPFVAYLNGVEILRNISGLPDEQFDISGFIHEMFPGENILAIEGSNDDMSDNGFTLLPYFELTERQDR